MEHGRISRLCSRLASPTRQEIKDLFGIDESEIDAAAGKYSHLMVVYTAFWAEFTAEKDDGIVYITVVDGRIVDMWEQDDTSDLATTRNGGYKEMVRPTLNDLVGHFQSHVLDKILRHLDPTTGDPAKGEVRCTSIESVLWNDSFVGVFYSTEKPDGSKGTKFMRFYTFTHAMRCLLLTDAERGKLPDVLLIDQYRRGRGKWTLMCPVGGENEENLADVLRVELRAEVGITLDEECSVYSLGGQYLDDGVCSDPVSLMVVTGVTPVACYDNPAEGIRRVRRMPWHDFVAWALSSECEDVWSTYFALRCIWDAAEGKLCIRGSYNSVQI